MIAQSKILKILKMFRNSSYTRIIKGLNLSVVPRSI